MKKTIFTLLALLFAGTALWAADYPDTSYILSSDGLTLTKWSGEETAIDMNADRFLKDVTAIGENAFEKNTTLQTIIIGDKVTSIGLWAFKECAALTSVTLPDGVTVIDEWGFGGCALLSKLNIPKSLVELKVRALSGCSLTSVELPEGFTTLGGHAFADCTALETVTLPSTIDVVWTRSFSNCSALKSLSVKKQNPVSANEKLGMYVFNGVPVATAMLYVPIGSGVKYEETYEWQNFVNIKEKDFTAGVAHSIADIGLTIGSSSAGFIHMKTAQPVTIQIYDATGKAVYKQLSPTSECSVQLPKGVYIVKAGNVTRKVIN